MGIPGIRRREFRLHVDETGHVVVEIWKKIDPAAALAALRGVCPLGVSVDVEVQGEA